MMMGGGNGAVWATLTLLVLLGIAAFVAWTMSRQGQTTDRPRLVADEFSFTPTNIRVTIGETVNLEFDNRGDAFHTFTIDELNLELRADGHTTATGSLVAPDRAGRYQIICDVPGHAAAGMRATLTVDPTPAK
jgi:uncharacterized cupredoxin-like copper-binding protein